MKKLIVMFVCAIGFTLAGSAKPARLIDVYNQFIERFADGNPAWKKDIGLGMKPGETPKPPYRLHYDDTLGYYTYRPKTWDDLSDYERFALQNDPRLPHFVKEITNQEEPPKAAPAPAPAAPKEDTKPQASATTLPAAAPAAAVTLAQQTTTTVPPSKNLAERPTPTPATAVKMPAAASPLPPSVAPATPQLDQVTETKASKLSASPAPSSDETKAAMDRLFGSGDMPSDAPTRLPTGGATGLDDAPKGVLVRDGEESYVYRFDPQELIKPSAVRLIEVQ